MAAPGARPLTPKQQRAAALIGAGFQHRAAARELGVADRTVSRWMGRSDFRDLVRKHREAALESKPTAKATLEAALVAVTSSGAPDWRTRVAAARALTGLEDPSAEGGDTERQVRETVIYKGALDDGHAG